MQEGGLSVLIIGDQMVHGTYGGVEGRRLVVGDDIKVAFFRLDSCKQSLVINQ